MATYQIETQSGIYEIETEATQPQEQAKDPRQGKFIPQMTKALYEGVPFGKRVIGMMPNAEQLKQTMESTPEPSNLMSGAGRLAGQIASAAPAMAGAEAVIPGKILAGALGFGAQRAGQVSSEGATPIQSLAEGAKETAIGYAGGKVIQKALPVIGAGAKSTFNAVVNKFPRLQTDSQLKANVSDKIQTAVWKAFRPTRKGKTSVSGMERFDDRAEEAITDIIANKDNNVFVDAEGMVKGNKLPESVQEVAQSVNEGRKRIFQEYNALSQQAGEDGAIVAVNNLDNVLAKYDTELLATENPALSNYVKRQRQGLALRQRFTPLEAENKIAEYNADLKATYNSGEFGRNTRLSIMDEMAKSLRKDLDSSIMNATGSTNYQSLKNKYGAYKTLADEIGKRLPVMRRASPSGFFDLADAFASGDVLSGAVGVATGDPTAPARIMRGIGINVGKTILKRRNDPNKIIAGMFKDVDGLLAEKGRRAIERTSVVSGGQSIPSAMNRMAQEADVVGAEQIGMTKKPGLPNLSAEKQGYKSGSGTIIPYANRKVPSGSGEVIQLPSAVGKTPIPSKKATSTSPVKGQTTIIKKSTPIKKRAN